MKSQDAITVMLTLDRLAYCIKHRSPGFFTLLERAARAVTVLRFGRRIAAARAQAQIAGTIDGKQAMIRTLDRDDLFVLLRFLEAMPEQHLKFFRPHGFDEATLKNLLASPVFMPYGLFVDGELVAYALLKVSPTGAAFAGSLLSPAFTGRGIGKFLSRYLYWQTALTGLKTHATISKENHASLKAYRANRDSRIVAELPNEYLLIEFPSMPDDETAPTLDFP